MYNIFIVEDDNVISSELTKHLKKWAYKVQCAKDFNNVLAEFIKFEPQLVLMDISLPFFNGFYWCAEIRKISKVPIVFISSASNNMNIVMAVNMGGDDFIAKPFDLEVLTVKVQAVLRRTYAYNEQAAYQEHNGVLFNSMDGTLTYQNQKLELTKNEQRIIQLLYENIGKIVTREQIMKRLWDNECFVDDNTLTVNMARIRRKLEDASIENFIQTKKGLGYIIGG
ncbi:MAG: DNA-binding response regulator [Eubacterium sp.]|jgi:DNA-binding response OmpR family regulator|nr:DNA-binding response regulator [Eubacterium sp.]